MSISVADDYSPYVMGRFPSDSKYNGEGFREKHLIPALEKLLSGEEDKLIVDLNGTYSPDPSFLEEAFGGAVRVLRKQGCALIEKMWQTQVEIIDDDEAQRQEVLTYISDELKNA